MADNDRLDDLAAAMQAADETFDDTPEGNAKFREFIRKLMLPRGVPFPKTTRPPVGEVGIRYGVPS